MRLKRLRRGIIRFGMGLAQRLRKAWWRTARPVRLGVHALAYTPEGQIILVQLSYADGWRLPGGGVKQGEDPRAALLRELREEIGMKAHGAVRSAGRMRGRADQPENRSWLFIVEDVVYRPRRWSLEIEAVGRFALDALPRDTAPIARRMIASAAGH